MWQAAGGRRRRRRAAGRQQGNTRLEGRQVVQRRLRVAAQVDDGQRVLVAVGGALGLLQHLLDEPGLDILVVDDIAGLHAVVAVEQLGEAGALLEAPGLVDAQDVVVAARVRVVVHVAGDVDVGHLAQLLEQLVVVHNPAGCGQGRGN